MNRNTLLILAFVAASVCYGNHVTLADTSNKLESGALSLDDAVARALTRNKTIYAAKEEISARDAAAIQAALLPNPDLSVEVENFGGSDAYDGFDSAETTIALRQLIELGGKRGKRAEAARSERAAAESDYESTRLDIVAETTKEFYQTLAIQARLVSIEELLKSARASTQTALAQVQAGGGSSVDTLRTEVASGQLEASLMRLRAELKSSSAKLSAYWNDDEPAASAKLVGDLYSVNEPPTFHSLSEDLLKTPYLRRWHAGEEREQAVLIRERANAIPDISAKLGTRHFEDSDDSALIAEVAVPLPLFNRNQGAVAEARPTVHRRHRALLVVRRLGALVGHLEE